MNNNYKHIFYFIIFCMAIIFTFKYVIDESPIYTFDYSGYFEHFKNMGAILKDSIGSFFSTMFESIQTSDYNFSSVFLLMPFYLIFGASRVSYIMSMVLIYLIPTIIVSEIILKNIFSKENKKYNKEEIFPIFVLLILFFYTRFWSPTLRGLSDISGVLFIALSYLIIQYKPLNKKHNYLWMILLGTTIYIPFLFRRWYLYFVVAFLLSRFIMDLYDFLKSYFKSKKFDKNQFFIYFFNYLTIGLTMIVHLLILQLPYIQRMFTEDYGDMYSSYQISLKGHITSFINEFGVIISLLMIFAIIISFIKKKYSKEMMFCFLNFFIFTFMFTRVQSMGVHHYLGISLWVILIILIGIRVVYESIKKKYLKYGLLAIISVIFIINFSTTYIVHKNVNYISQNNKYYKFYYENFDELNRLINDLRELSFDDKENNVKFSVIAESVVISDNIVDLLGDYNIRDNIVYTNHIDSRDDITMNALLTKYVVVTNVPQTGSSATGQHVISVPNNYILNNEKIGENYELFKGPYYLDDGVQAFIYKKNAPISVENATSYFEEMFQYNSHWKDQYDLFTQRLLASDVQLGSIWGSFKKYDGKKSLLMFPGESDTIIDIPVNNLDATLNLKFYMLEENGVADVKITIMLDDEEIYQDIVSTSKKDEVSVDLSNGNNLRIDLNYNEELVNDYLYIDYDLK